MSETRLTTYEVGKPFPGVFPPGNGVQYNYRGGGHELVVSLDRPHPQELQAFGKGALRFGLIVRPEALFLLYRPEGMPWSDAPYSWRQVQRKKPAEAVAPFELPTEQSRAMLHVLVVDSATGLLAVMRTTTFSPRFSRRLHAAIREQMQSDTSETEYNLAVDRMYAIYPDTEQMAALAEILCTGGEP